MSKTSSLSESGTDAGWSSDTEISLTATVNDLPAVTENVPPGPQAVTITSPNTCGRIPYPRPRPRRAGQATTIAPKFPLLTGDSVRPMYLYLSHTTLITTPSQSFKPIHTDFILRHMDSYMKAARAGKEEEEEWFYTFFYVWFDRFPIRTLALGPLERSYKRDRVRNVS